MERTQPVFGFALALVLLSQTGCCCCVTIPVGPQPGEEGDFQLEPLVPLDPDLDEERDPEGASSTEVESGPADD